MRAIVGAFIVLAAGGVARADEVSDQLDQAMAAYQRHDVGGALAALDTAASLLREQRAETWKALLPAPLPGWQAEEAETTSLSRAVLGGFSTVSRTYRRDGERIEIAILTDSPILQGIGAMLSSVLSNGVATRTINGRRLTYLKDDNSYTAIVGDKVMVRLTADVATSEAAVQQYLAAIDFAAIERASR